MIFLRILNGWYFNVYSLNDTFKWYRHILTAWKTLQRYLCLFSCSPRQPTFLRGFPGPFDWGPLWRPEWDPAVEPGTRNSGDTTALLPWWGMSLLENGKKLFAAYTNPDLEGVSSCKKNAVGGSWWPSSDLRFGFWYDEFFILFELCEWRGGGGRRKQIIKWSK